MRVDPGSSTYKDNNKRVTEMRNTTLLVVMAVLLPLAASPSVHAQDRRSATIEEVIVTARKVEESLQDTPVSVAAFSSADLEQMGVSEAKDVANFTPNLRIQKQSGSQDNYAMAIRGVSSGETALAIDPTVAIYQDGVYIARSTGLAFDFVDLERIEVLRGPQGTLFGRNTIGGAINVITEKPQGAMAVKVKMATGNRDYQRSQVSLDLPEMGGVAMRLSALTSERNGILKSTYGGRLGDAESNAYRFALRWTASEQLIVDFAWDVSRANNNSNRHQLSEVKDIYSDPNSNFYGGRFFEQAEAAESAERKDTIALKNTDLNENGSDIDSASLTLEWEITPALTLKSISAYREWHSVATATEFGTFDVENTGDVIDLRDTSNPQPVAAGTSLSLFSATRDSRQRQFTQEFQFTGELLDERLRYTAGVYYFEESGFEDNPQQFVLSTPFLLSAAGAPEAAVIAGRGTGTLVGAPFLYSLRNESVAAYGQFTYEIIRDLDVTLGLRQTWDEKEATLRNSLDGSVQTVSDNDDWSNFNPSLTVDYRWSEQLNTYARIASGYRSGGYNVRAQTVSSFKTPFDQEELTSYELGIKSDWFDRRLRLNASVFRLDYTDRQIAQFEAGSGGASTRIVNAGKSQTDGFELEALWVPMTGLRVQAAYGYLDVDYLEFQSAPVNPVTGFSTSSENEDISDVAATNLYAPRHSWSASVEYQMAPWSFGQLSLRVDANFVDDLSFHPQLNLYDETDNYSLVNARIALNSIPVGKDGKLKLVAWGKNLTNKEYRDFGIDFGVLGIAINTYGELRTFGLDLVYEFNRG